MSILFRNRPAPRPEPVDVDEARDMFIPMPPGYDLGMGYGAAAGMPVTIETAMRQAAAWACVRVLTSTIANLPVHQHRGEGAARETMNEAPIVSRPSARVRRRAWIGQVIRSGATAGNAYGKVVAADSIGRAQQIETINPSKISWRERSNEMVPYIDGKEASLYPIGDLWHLPASQFLAPGASVAMSPVDAASASLLTSMYAERYTSNYFADGAHPTAIAKSKVKISKPDADLMKDALRRIFSAGNREPLVMGSDWELTPFSIDPDKTLFLDLLRFEVEQASRIWGVPPQMISAAVSGQNVTYANASASDLSFLKYGVDTWVGDLEEAWSELLPRPQYVKINTDAILRVDVPTREKMFDIQLKNKTRTVNEVRALRDEPPFPKDGDLDYDKPGIPGGPDMNPLPQSVDTGTPEPVATPSA